MSKTWKRILLFFLGVPALISVILFLPYYQHLAINIIAVGLCVIGAHEFRGFFIHAGYAAGTKLAPFLAGILPLAAYFETAGILPPPATLVSLVIVLLFILSLRLVEIKGGQYDTILGDISSSFAIVLYPSFFLTYFVKLSTFDAASYVILTFLIIVFANDTGAYFFGSLVGDGSRGVTKISPKKSVVGFVAGLVCSVGFSVLCNAVFPGIYGERNPWLLAVLIGGVVGVVTILGDLVESALKRSAGLKDSGTAIPGRGGVLDSVDSILFAAPVFFYLLQITL